MSGQQHAPAAVYPRERPGTHFTGGWVGLSAGSRTVQPLVNRYTDWATGPTNHENATMSKYDSRGSNSLHPACTCRKTPSTDIFSFSPYRNVTYWHLTDLLLNLPYLPHNKHWRHQHWYRRSDARHTFFDRTLDTSWPTVKTNPCFIRYSLHFKRPIYSDPEVLKLLSRAN